MIEWAVISILLGTLFLVLYLYVRQGSRIESRAREIFEAWQAAEQDAVSRWQTLELERLSDEKAKVLFEGWRAREEEAIRADAIRRSESVTRGKVTEHLVPFFPGFPYDPRDARFLGSPVDLIVFDGLAEGRIREIVFAEIKTSRNPSLSRRERDVRDCIGKRQVSYTLLQVPPGTDE
ncbi:MAG TPA: Holliday junction resolvase-like protein [Methanoregulaceae archaeon]|nr:MAG: Holliday junction resolvase [Methanolinea sp.]HON80639.1 Holliday junction resolvase-like protein [Methanoregulaceae archaeon]HPD09373.1 Holliday junction resolvase-like protein [Methanoregulaceae archaeon]HRT14834.1 Holliday junction resolvase-like protein [Methanoregulaceae archaeon]HRU30407.1 Holliday junction resolvase-like protein [Methanoregulaceae archaeon]